MRSYKFQVGDRVRCIEAVSNNEEVKGKLGTIKMTMGGNSELYGVEFDDRIRGGHRRTNSRHSGTSYCADGHGWWCRGRFLEHADEPSSPSDIKMLFEDMFNDDAET